MIFYFRGTSRKAATDPRLALPLSEPCLDLAVAIKSARILIRREHCWISPGKASQKILQGAAGRCAGSTRQTPYRMRKRRYRLAAEYAPQRDGFRRHHRLLRGTRRDAGKAELTLRSCGYVAGFGPPSESPDRTRAALTRMTALPPLDYVIAESIDYRLCPDIKNSRCCIRLIGKPLGKGSEFLSHFGSQWTVIE